MAMKCDACGVDVYEWDGKPACECYPYGIDAPKPATTEPPEWVDDGPHNVTPDWWDEVAEAMFTARRKAKREVNAAPTREEIIAEKQSRWAAEDRARLVARAMSTPLPHDPDIHTRLMPYRSQSHDKQR